VRSKTNAGTAEIARLWVIWLIIIPFVHGVLPWVISTLLPRHGWRHGAPGNYNWIGLGVVPLAAALLIWSLWWRRSVAAVNAPSYLMTQGPYAITRNPLYVAYLGLWLGWAGFFGSIGVFVGWLILCMVAGFVIVPKEERMLREQFAQAYTIYEMRVPRWVGRVKPSITRS
jgi:protein-S-isoprenylcysteine O-methyltransferase Ste14